MEVGQGSDSYDQKRAVLKLESEGDKLGGTLVGKILTKKNLNVPTVITMIKKGWQLDKEVEIHELDRSELIFLFRFQNAGDVSRVLLGRPWSIQGFLLNLKPWEDFMVVKDVNFGETPFWVQFHGLPVEAFDDSNAKVLGDTVGEIVMYEKSKINGRLSRGFIRVRSVIQVSEPLTHGFWVPRGFKLLAWVSVKYERLHNFYYICGCIGHEGRGCKVSGKNSGEDGLKAYGSWLSTPSVRTFKDLVVVCKEGWCEVNGGDDAEEDVSGDQNHHCPRQNGVSGPLVAVELNPYTRIHRCQEENRFVGSSDSRLSVPCQGNSAPGSCSEEMSVKVDHMLNGEATVDPSRDSPACDDVTDPIPIACVTPPFSGVGASLVEIDNIGPSDLSSCGPSAQEVALGYRVEFPLDLEPQMVGITSHNGLSPISSMSLSLNNFHLKRPHEEEADLGLCKRQRRLTFEDPTPPLISKSGGHQSLRGRRKNFKAVKSFIRNRNAVDLPVTPVVTRDFDEIDFPDSWLAGNGSPEFISSLSD
ncbi:hypothetical protein QN277_018286 [Acacia crassicarpa]|uniref:DUF4283 domain-containing protein n=1 Tax=Acacia crassicarpa TaxID=499986 RepID=A0AAE1MUJ8_9FABA|nr:hypothetical protein QN277_018286 [Acacia crassicarpa]